MEPRGTFTRILAVAGTVLVWLPILATVLTGLIGSLMRRRLMVDYLMPAELFFFALLGGGLLLWAALRARSHRKLFGWGLPGILVLWLAPQLLAVATGLASGETEIGGWAWVLVLVLLAIYTLGVIALGVAGIALLRDLFRHKQTGGDAAASPMPG